MRLYYTVASEPEVVQVDPKLSLGRYKSASALANSVFGNMFSDITNTTLTNFNQNQYVGLVLKNESGLPATGVKMWFEYGDVCYSLFRIAAVTMVMNADGMMQMEHIDTNQSKPLYSEFYEADGEVNAVTIGDMAVDELVGIWIERELLMSVIKEDQAKVYEPDPNPEYPGRYRAIELAKLDEIKIGISWT